MISWLNDIFKCKCVCTCSSTQNGKAFNRGPARTVCANLQWNSWTASNLNRFCKDQIKCQSVTGEVGICSRRYQSWCVRSLCINQYAGCVWWREVEYCRICTEVVDRATVERYSVSDKDTIGINITCLYLVCKCECCGASATCIVSKNGSIATNGKSNAWCTDSGDNINWLAKDDSQCDRVTRYIEVISTGRNCGDHCSINKNSCR